MIKVVPLRTALVDEEGNLTRPWAIFFTALLGAIARTAAAPVQTMVVRLPDGAGTTAISSDIDPVRGADLVIAYLQGVPTGGQQISLSAQFFSGNSVDISMLPGKLTICTYTGLSDGTSVQWYETSRRSY